jgi:hypothetical protein
MYRRQRRHLHILWWWNLEILFAPLNRSSPFIGEPCAVKLFKWNTLLYIAERTQSAVYIVRCLWAKLDRNILNHWLLTNKFSFLNRICTIDISWVDNRLALHGLYLWRHVLSTAPPFYIIVVKIWNTILPPSPAVALTTNTNGTHKGKGGGQSRY